VRILSVGNRYPPWSVGGYETIWAAAVRALRAAGHPTLVLTTVPDPTDRAVTGVPDPTDRAVTGVPDPTDGPVCDVPEPTDGPVSGAPDPTDGPVSGAGPADVRRQLSWYWHAHAFPRRSLRECIALEQANADVLSACIRSWQPDAIMWWAMGGMSLSLLEQARRAGVPALSVVGDDWPSYAPRVDGWSRRWRGPVSARLAPVAERFTGLPARLDLDAAARWTFISAHVLAGARAAGWRLDDATVHHPGVDPARFARAPDQPWRWRLLYCGRIDPRKGIATAVRALSGLPAEATLTIDGDSDHAHAAELMALAAELGVSDRVRFTVSDAEDVPAAYAASDAVLFPVTWQEPWGLVPIEAMAVGRPVVATDAGGGPAEYLEPDRNCLQFPAGDAAGLAAAVRQLADDDALRDRLVQAGSVTAAGLGEAAFHGALIDELEAVTAA